jgi:putative transposase
MKQSKKQKILKVESSVFSKDGKTFCKSVLGKEMKTNDGSDFSNVNRSCTIQYNSLTNRFTLLIPVMNQIEENSKHANDVISLDPGIRTFLAGYSNGHTLDICDGLKNKLKRYLLQIDKINASSKSTNIKRKAENKRYVKISNLVDDLHWKSINYLTDSYKTIQIGNMSTKSIVRNKESNNLDDMSKRIGLLMKLYVFRERLKYKCATKGCYFKIVDECFTSKMCSYCGKINETLGKSKNFKCPSCHKEIDRDTNGSKNIYLIGISK